MSCPVLESGGYKHACILPPDTPHKLHCCWACHRTWTDEDVAG